MVLKVVIVNVSVTEYKDALILHGMKEPMDILQMYAKQNAKSKWLLDNCEDPEIEYIANNSDLDLIPSLPIFSLIGYLREEKLQTEYMLKWR